MPGNARLSVFCFIALSMLYQRAHVKINVCRCSSLDTEVNQIVEFCDWMKNVLPICNYLRLDQNICVCI